MTVRITGTRSAKGSTARVLVVLAMMLSSAVGAQVPVKRSIIGNVTSDSAGAHSIGSVELTIRTLGVQARTNWMGEYRLPAIPPGKWLVEARHVGYRSAADSVTVSATGDASLDFVLQPAPVTLDSVVTRADAKRYISPALNGFVERMNAHQGGYFIGDSVLRQNEFRQLGSVLESRAPGLELYRYGNTTFAITARAGGVAAQCGVFQHCRRPDGSPIVGSKQVPAACYVSVYLDGVLLFDPKQVSNGSPPTNLNSINVTDLTGVEYYPSTLTVPAEYQSNSPCGALLLWTREK